MGEPAFATAISRRSASYGRYKWLLLAAHGSARFPRGAGRWTAAPTDSVLVEGRLLDVSQSGGVVEYRLA